MQKEDHGVDGSSGDEAEVEGLVTRFVSPTDFDVAGQRVTTGAGTTYVGGTVADLRADVKVEVEGRLDSSGTVVAGKVVFKRAATVQVEARVDGIDTVTSTLRALGLTIVVDAATRKEDHESDDQFFALDDLRVGDWVEVRGYRDPAGNGRVIATRLERDEAEDEVELRGPASDLQSPRLKVFGVNVGRYMAGAALSLALLFFSGNAYYSLYMVISVGLFALVMLAQLAGNRFGVRES